MSYKNANFVNVPNFFAPKCIIIYLEHVCCVCWEDYVASVQTMSRDMIKLQLSQYFCRATSVSCSVGVTLCCDFYTFRSCNTCTQVKHSCLIEKLPPKITFNLDIKLPLTQISCNFTPWWQHIFALQWEKITSYPWCNEKEIPTFAYFCKVATYDIIFWCRLVYYKTLILWNSLIYTILNPFKWRHKPSQSSQRILARGSYSSYKIWQGLWRHFYGFKIV